MKLICTASKVSWFTVGREYEMDEYGVVKDDSKGEWSNMFWPLEPHKGGYRTEFLEDAEFAIAPGFEPVTAADDAPLSEQVQHEALLAAVVQMADEEGCRDSFDRHLASIRHRFGLIKNPQSQRAFLLALAYFAEEKSQ
jgi:hypothetical protein